LPDDLLVAEPMDRVVLVWRVGDSYAESVGIGRRKQLV
jgi:hypothetical protein